MTNRGYNLLVIVSLILTLFVIMKIADVSLGHQDRICQEGC